MIVSPPAPDMYATPKVNPKSQRRSGKMSILDLPSHVLVQVACHLDHPSLKSLAVAHSLFTPAAEVWLYRRLTLPLHNPHRPVVPACQPLSWECDYNLSTQWEPVKPTLARSLAEEGWKEDLHQSNHLDASLRFINRSLSSSAERAGYIREVSIDLKKRYHDAELDMNAASTTTAFSDVSGGGGYRGGMWFDGKEWGWEWDDPASSARAMLHLAQLRRDENPDACPSLRNTFTSLPVMRGVRRLELEIYESWQGYLDHVFALVPNLEHLIIRPNALLVDSPLEFPARTFSNIPKDLKSVRFESMLDCFQPLVVDFLNECKGLEHVVLADRERGSRRQWALHTSLSGSLASSESLRRLEMGRTAREALRDHGHALNEHILVEA